MHGLFVTTFEHCWLTENMASMGIQSVASQYGPFGVEYVDTIKLHYHYI
jgi:hypothetical protein